jgi:hypothetical protein
MTSRAAPMSPVRTDALRLYPVAHLSRTLPVSSNCLTIRQIVFLDNSRTT